MSEDWDKEFDEYSERRKERINKIHIPEKYYEYLPSRLRQEIYKFYKHKQIKPIFCREIKNSFMLLVEIEAVKAVNLSTENADQIIKSLSQKKPDKIELVKHDGTRWFTPKWNYKADKWNSSSVFISLTKGYRFK